jgi:hypothetical protein
MAKRPVEMYSSPGHTGTWAVAAIVSSSGLVVRHSDGIGFVWGKISGDLPYLPASVLSSDTRSRREGRLHVTSPRGRGSLVTAGCCSKWVFEIK